MHCACVDIIISFSHAYHACSNYNHATCEFDQVFMQNLSKQGSFEKSKLLAMYIATSTSQYQHGHACMLCMEEWPNTTI